MQYLINTCSQFTSFTIQRIAKLKTRFFQNCIFLELSSVWLKTQNINETYFYIWPVGLTQSATLMYMIGITEEWWRRFLTFKQVKQSSWNSITVWVKEDRISTAKIIWKYGQKRDKDRTRTVLSADLYRPKLPRKCLLPPMPEKYEMIIFSFEIPFLVTRTVIEIFHHWWL